MASALALCRSSRSSSVASERWASHASNGPGMLPVCERQVRSRAASCGSPAVATPSSRSECPLSDLVPLSTERSAPWSSGRWPSGVASVLSTAVSAPATRGRARDLGEVGDLQARVGGGLDPDEPGAGRRGDDLARVARDEAGLHPVARQAVDGEVADAGVGVLGRHEDVAGAERVEHDRGDGGHTGGEDHRLAALERGERALEVRPGGVLIAPVAVLGGVDGALQVIRRRQHRAGEQRGALGGSRHAGVDRARAGAPREPRSDSEVIAHIQAAEARASPGAARTHGCRAGRKPLVTGMFRALCGPRRRQ